MAVASWLTMPRSPLTHPVPTEPGHEVDADVALHAGAWRHSLRYRRIRPDLSPRDVPAAPG